MTVVVNALDTAQSYLKSLDWDLETVPEDVQPLVQKLVHNVLVARGTATEVTRRAERQSGDLQAALEKVSFLSTAMAEKEREVVYLRQELASQAQRAKGDNELKLKLDNSETRIQALENAAQQEAAKSARLEAERDGLKLKVQSLLEVSHQCKALGIAVGGIASSMDANAPLTPAKKSRDTSTGKTAMASTACQSDICLIQATASRVSALESELSTARKKAEDHKELSSCLKEANAAARSEIAGLKAQLVARKNTLDLQSFEQLSRHANKLGKELEELRQRSVDPKELAAAQHEKIAAEARAAAAETSRQAVVMQVDILRSELEKLQREIEAASFAENKVAKLRVALDECKVQEAAARAAAELAEGRCAELQDRLERRDAALNKAQARCRSLEADLCRLRQLQNLKAAAAAASKNGKEEENEEVAQLKLQCAAMAGHLNKSMELQEAALEAATAATLERDEITNVAIKLKTELEAAKVQLQDAAAAAAAVRYRITSSTSSSVPVSELLNASLAAEEEEQGRRDDSQSCNTTSCTDETQIYVQTAISEALEEVQAARCDAMEAQIEARQEREVADTLRERCATLESQLQNLQNDIAMVGNGGSDSDVEVSLRFELEQKKQECHDLAAAGAQADVAMRDCLEQLRAVTTELQQTRSAAVSTRAELHEREMQLESLQNAAQALGSERIALHEQLVILQQQNEGFTASFEDERQAAANEFDALRSNMQDLARQYQELCSQAAAMQRERNAATQFAETSASQAAFYEQETRAKESALGHAEASYAAVVEHNRRLQEAVMSLQQEVASQACRAQFSSDCAHAALQRRAATAEGSTALVEVRLSDAMAEVSILRQQLTVQATKSEELEALLLEERRKQFREEENVNIVNVINLQDSEEPRSEIMKDAVDEAMMQRLAELEIECVQLREELQRVQRGTGLEAVPKEEEDPSPPPESVTAPHRNVLEQLATIAEGLKDLGSK